MDRRHGERRTTAPAAASAACATAAVVARPAPWTSDFPGDAMTDPLPRGSETSLVLTHLMQPADANFMGNIHGGIIMKLIDEAAGACAYRFCRTRVVTAAIDRIDFHYPVQIGNLVRFMANVNYAGRTSVEVGVRVEAEDLASGSVTHTNSAYLVFVALDDSGRPIPVPPLEPAQTEQQGLVRRSAEERTRASGSPCANRPTSCTAAGVRPQRAGPSGGRRRLLQPQQLLQRLVGHVELVLTRLAGREQALHLDAGPAHASSPADGPGGAPSRRTAPSPCRCSRGRRANVASGLRSLPAARSSMLAARFVTTIGASRLEPQRSCSLCASAGATPRS